MGKIKFFRSRIIEREDGIPYLKRWNIISTPWGGIKLHKIMVSDYDCLHDHPWAFLSIILKGGYVEYSEKEEVRDTWGGSSFEVETKQVSRIYHPGQILWRPARWAHRLEIHQPCWTLVFTFKREREWGFFTKLRGWIPWTEYLHSRDGAGCNT